MTFAIIAEFLLGVYRGHVGGRMVEPTVGPARLHAALVNAAAAGTRAVFDGDSLVPCSEDAAALSWLETHPPDGLVRPEHTVNPAPAMTFRDDGTLFKNKSKATLTAKLAWKPVGGSVAVNGAFAWTWEQEPPEEVREALAALCRDVSHVGTTESPVRLFVGDTRPTHTYSGQSGVFAGLGVDVPVASVGRTAELHRAHAATVAKIPSARADRFGGDEKPVRAPVTTRATTSTVRYVPVEAEPVSTPWEHVLCLPLEADVPADLRVRAAVSVHRGLINVIDNLGHTVPPMVTGVQPPGQPRPANRVAIQFLPHDLSAHHAGPDSSVLAVLIPPGEQPAAEVVAQAVDKLTAVRITRGHKVRITGPARHLPAGGFWHPPDSGEQRWWCTEPAAVPENRPLRREWSGRDTVAVSVALLWRDTLAVAGRGDQRYRALAQAARDRGVHVELVRRVVDGDFSRFVHKTQPGSVLHPYRATLHLGDLADERTLLALGQSRHMGCGLLVPRDLPADLTTETDPR